MATKLHICHSNVLSSNIKFIVVRRKSCTDIGIQHDQVLSTSVPSHMEEMIFSFEPIATLKTRFEPP